MSKKRRKKKRSEQTQKPSQQIPPPEPVKEEPESMEDATPPAIRETEKGHPERIQESPQPKRLTKWGKRQKRITLMIGMMAILALAFCTLYFGSTSFRNLFSKAGSYDESMEHIHEDVRLTSRFRQKRTDSDIRYSDFVGSDSCMLCHIEQFTLWRNSTHGRAGGDPGRVKIVARFDDQPLHFKDATVIPSITKDGDYIFTLKQERLPDRIVTVDGVVGGGHMEGGGTQCFFTKFPDGTLRFVPFDYNRTDDIWFVQLKDGRWVPITREVSIHNLFNWPPYRVLGTTDRFSSCQNCHGSQILIEYDSQTGKYITRYTTLEINCESCHGPGRRHIDLIRSADLDTLTDIGIVHLTTVSKDESIDKCFECHAEKAALTNDFLSGKPIETHFALKFPILASEPYMPDGRIREFAYQQGHIFSDCYINGSMTCVDCHDPHSQEYRDIFFQPLIGKFDDGQCTDCHPSKADMPESHSYHLSDSPGNVCTACHMPFLQHPMLGPSVRFARSDHIIPIPRPEFDASLGIENACQQCHVDESLAWQQKKTDDWYRKIKPHNRLITNNMKAKSVTDIMEASDLLLNPDDHFPAAQVTGLFDFMKRFLKPNMSSLDQEIIDKLKRYAESSDLDVKALALVALHLTVDQDEDNHQFLMETLESSGDYEEGLRYRWAFAMDYLGILFTLRRDYPYAILAHKKSLEIKPSDAYTLYNLGIAYKSSGNHSDAIMSFKQAIQVDPTNANIHFQLAHTYSLTRQKNEAIEALQNGLKLDPNNQNAKQMLRQLQS